MGQVTDTGEMLNVILRVVPYCRAWHVVAGIQLQLLTSSISKYRQCSKASGASSALGRQLQTTYEALAVQLNTTLLQLSVEGSQHRAGIMSGKHSVQTWLTI